MTTATPSCSVPDPADGVARRAGPGTVADLVAIEAAAPADEQGIAREDPELFATFRKVTNEARDVVGAHVDHLASQLARLVQDGVSDGEFTSDEPQVTGRAVPQATALFHHPAHADEWGDPALPDQLEAVLDLVLDGLRPRD